MTRRLLTAVALAIAFGTFFLSDPPPATNRAPTMGLIGHRGQFYRFEDLMNPEFRMASRDPFVQSFAPPDQFAAEPWAGISTDEAQGGSFEKILELRHDELKSRVLIESLNPADRSPWAGIQDIGWD